MRAGALTNVLWLAVAGLTVHAAAQAPARSSETTTASTLRQIAYVKASNPGEDDKFGDIVALSGDGNTLAVGAPLESRAAGAVHVYTRNGNRWVEQASIKASKPDPDDQFGYGVSLSADGGTLAVSAPYEDSGATGINGNQSDNSMPNSGAVYVFSRTGSTWSQLAYIKASNTGEKDEGDQFGYSVAVSGDGNTLAVGAIGEDSSAAGINGNQADNSANGAGAVYVFARIGGTWAQQAYVKSSKPARNILYGYSVALSANGNTMAVGEYDADRGRGALYVLTRSSATWSQQARLQPATLDPQDSMGCWIAISDDGNTIAAGAMDEDTLVPGINVVQGGHSGIVDGPDDNSAGAVYVFVRNGTTWTEQANLKASNVGKKDWFGVRLALSGDGNTLAVGAPNEDSAAKGINGKQDDDSADEAGALYVFTRTGSTWKQDYYVKGSNTEKFDEFGSSASLSRDGKTMAVGAHFESGGAPRSGAAYVFVLALAGGQAEPAQKPLMAEDVFKNVQVLKGIPADEFMGTMSAFSAALGESCETCHDASGGWASYALDTVPRKRTARRMVTMMAAINQANFGGRQAVTCFTCHRGANRPRITPFLAEVYGEAPPEGPDEGVRPAPDAPSADQVLDKYVQAIGGASRLANLTSFVAKGFSGGYGPEGDKRPVEIFAKAPGQRTTIIHTLDGDSTATFDGRAGWYAAPHRPVPVLALTGGQLDGARLDAQLSFPAQIKQAFGGWRAGAVTTVNDRPAQVLQGTSPGGTLASLYFDRESGLLVRLVRFAPSKVGRLPTQIDYADYRDVAGVKLPFRWTVTWLSGVDTFELIEVRPNVPIDATKFGRPSAK